MRAGLEFLHASYEMNRVNHQEAYRSEDACTNVAEMFFSRIRRAEIGHHHHIAGVYFVRYAQERPGAKIIAVSATAIRSMALSD